MFKMNGERMNKWVYDTAVWSPQEATPFLGNGFIGGHIPIDGHGAGGNPWGAAVAAFYVGPEETFAQVPHWLNVGLLLDGKPVRTSWVNFRRVLDLRRGLMTTAYTDITGSVRVSTVTFCHRERKHVAAYQLTVEALKDVNLEISPQLNAAACPVQPGRITRMDAPGSDEFGWTLDFADMESRAAQVMALEVSGFNGGKSVGQLDNEMAIGRRFSAALGRGRSCEIRSIVTTCIGSDPLVMGRATAKQAAEVGYAALEQSHIQAMEELWSGVDVEIGDVFLERRYLSSLFYLLSGYRQDVVWGGCATGLSSAGSWGGSIFWDTEFYMFPPMLALYPQMARNMLLYRSATLAAAAQNARDHGEAGARFAWQSKKTGRPFAGVFEDERHVSSNIAYCAWWYGLCTGDREFTDTHGRKLLREVARNWASRAIADATHPEQFHIAGVIPSDEHVLDHHVGKPITDSVMTNAYAAWVLDNAADLPDAGITESERRLWKAIAAGLYLPRDEERGIYREYVGYNGHAIKQADVGHLFFPLCLTRDAAEIRRNVYYYADRERETGLYLTHSPYVYGAALSRAGDVEGVERFLRLSDRNFVGPFDIPRESNYGGSVVVTGAGSFLSLMLYGVAGLENMGPCLASHACVPPSLGHLKISGIHFQGRRYSLSAEAATRGNAAAAALIKEM